MTRKEDEAGKRLSGVEFRESKKGIDSFVLK